MIGFTTSRAAPRITRALRRGASGFRRQAQPVQRLVDVTVTEQQTQVVLGVAMSHQSSLLIPRPWHVQCPRTKMFLKSERCTSEKPMVSGEDFT